MWRDSLPGSDQWRTTWHALGAAQCDESLRDALIARYEEPTRHYHTTQHLAELFGHWPQVRSAAIHPAEIALALWFHDAVYDPARGDNEARGAAWARAAMVVAGVPLPVIDRVDALIMATRHDVVSAESDACILVDLDLAILGAAPARFDEYEQQVRAEYAWVPAEMFRLKRQELLAGLFARRRIFQTEYFHDRYEATARANLKRSLERPSAGASYLTASDGGSY